MELRRSSFALLLALAAGASVLTACGGSDTPSGTVDQPISVGREESEFDPSGGATGGGETTAAEGGESAPAEGGESAPAEGGGDAAAGKEVFASAGCAGCHTLADAGASGTVGPNLDEAQPDEALVVERVTNGQGAMPSFADQLTEQQIADVAAYVSSVAGQ